MSRPSPRKLYSLIALMVVLWTLNFVIGKMALREFPALLAAGLRASLAGLLILPVYLATGFRQDRVRWTRADLPVLLFLGLVGVGLNQVFFLLGLQRTSVAHAAFLIALTPLMVLLLSAIAGHERLSATRLGGMGVAAAGAVLLQSRPGRGGEATLLGDLFILLASVTFALFTVVGKRATANHGPITINTFAYVGGGLLLAPVTIWESSRFAFAHVSVAGWASLFYMALFPSVVCYLIFYYALTWLPASRVAAFTYLQPPLATVLAVVFLGDPVTRSLAAGGALVLSGVWLAERG